VTGTRRAEMAASDLTDGASTRRSGERRRPATTDRLDHSELTHATRSRRPRGDGVPARACGARRQLQHHHPPATRTPGRAPSAVRRPDRLSNTRSADAAHRGRQARRWRHTHLAPIPAQRDAHRHGRRRWSARHRGRRRVHHTGHLRQRSWDFHAKAGPTGAPQPARPCRNSATRSPPNRRTTRRRAIRPATHPPNSGLRAAPATT
jgi:hypothetical protein